MYYGLHHVMVSAICITFIHRATIIVYLSQVHFIAVEFKLLYQWQLQDKKKVRFLTRNFVNNLPVSVCFTFLMFSYEICENKCIICSTQGTSVACMDSNIRIVPVPMFLELACSSLKRDCLQHYRGRWLNETQRMC